MKLQRNLVKRVLFPVFGFLFALLALIPASTPAYAVPSDSYAIPSDSNSNPAETAETLEAEKAKKAEDLEAEKATEKTTTQEEKDPCHAQVEGVAWIICPSTNFFAKVIDGIQSWFAEQFTKYLTVQPMAEQQEAPIFKIWATLRNISNVLFVIFILICILSQITSIGISNYGIKRMFPKLIVGAILVNISWVLCLLLIDISNIVGASLYSFITNISNQAAEGGIAISATQLIGTLGVGGVIAGIAITSMGGFMGTFIALIPVIVSALFAILSAFLMAFLRQAVIWLLLMVSPLAFACYLLPNTEKYFQKWKQTFSQMLFFFPMMSALFGASQLIGWAVMATTGNPILGFAIQLFPLFYSFKLMRMSGTALGAIGGLLAGVGNYTSGLARANTVPLHQAQRAKYLGEDAKKYQLPRRTAQWFNDRRIRSEEDAKKYSAAANLRGQAYAAQYQNRRGNKITRRGESLYNLQGQNAEYESAILHATTDFDEGISDKTNNRRQQARLQRADRNIITNFSALKDEKARALDVNLENLKSYEKGVNNAVRANALRAKGQAYNAEDAARYDRIARVAGARREEGINTIVANAIAVKAKARTEITGDYFSLFNEASYTADIDEYLANSLSGFNENSMAAAIQVMMMRGDTDLIAKKLFDGTSAFNSSNPNDPNYSRDIAMQKRLSDTLLRYKNDSAVLWGYAKCLNMARGKAANIRINNEAARAAGRPQDVEPEMPDFFEFADFLRPDGQAAQYHLDLESMIASISDADIAATQDRTVWNYAKELDRLFFTTKQRRFALFNKPNEGEKLQSLIDVHLGKDSSWKYSENGTTVSDKTSRKVLVFRDQAALDKAKNNIFEILKDNNADQITRFKTDTITPFASIFADSTFQTTGPNGEIVFDFRDDARRSDMIVNGLNNLNNNGGFRPGIAGDLHKKASLGHLDTMNPEVRRLLNQVFHFDGGNNNP